MAHQQQEIQERDRVSELKKERIILQRKTFQKFVNAYLEDSGHRINNLFQDLSDGKMLIKLVEKISNQKIGNPCNMIFSFLLSINVCI